MFSTLPSDIKLHADSRMTVGLSSEVDVPCCEGTFNFLSCLGALMSFVIFKPPPLQWSLCPGTGPINWKTNLHLPHVYIVNSLIDMSANIRVSANKHFFNLTMCHDYFVFEIQREIRNDTCL